MVYDNIVKECERDGTKEARPDVVYAKVKAALMQFAETAMEKQVRISQEWNGLAKSRDMSSLEFQTKFIRLTTQLEQIGMGLTRKSKYMSYLTKVGGPINETIRLDRRQRPDGAGGTSERLAETWEEAHAVLQEIEAVKSGSKILNDPLGLYSAGQAAGSEKKGK